MKYFFQAEKESDTLVVGFHGTGNNEYQLLTIISKLYPNANILTYRGEVGVGENRRFFAPLENGQLPKESLEQEVQHFLTEDWPKFKGKYQKVIFIGFSNGANFILGMLKENPEIADTLLLLHPAPLDFSCSKGSTKTRILMTTGSQDTLVIPGAMVHFSNEVKQYFPHTTLQLVDGEHAITEDELKKIEDWL